MKVWVQPFALPVPRFASAHPLSPQSVDTGSMEWSKKSSEAADHDPACSSCAKLHGRICQNDPCSDSIHLCYQQSRHTPGYVPVHTGHAGILPSFERLGNLFKFCCAPQKGKKDLQNDPAPKKGSENDPDKLATEGCSGRWHQSWWFLFFCLFVFFFEFLYGKMGDDYSDDDDDAYSDESDDAERRESTAAPGSLIARGRAFLPCRHWKDTQEAWGTLPFPWCCAYCCMFFSVQ